METKHTPGPWVICSDRFSPPTIIATGVFNICEMSGAASNEGVMADAKLIAAAPELLEALQMVRDYVVTMKGKGHEYQIAIDAAIKKATE